MDNVTLYNNLMNAVSRVDVARREHAAFSPAWSMLARVAAYLNKEAEAVMRGAE